MDYYLTTIDMADIPNLNENYNLPPPYNKILFKTQPTNPAIKLGIKTKYNYNGVHNIRPWSNICQRVHAAIQPYLNGKYRIYSSWINYYEQGNAVQWHHHIRQLVDINSILFLTIDLYASASSFDPQERLIIYSESRLPNNPTNVFTGNLPIIFLSHSQRYSSLYVNVSSR